MFSKCFKLVGNNITMKFLIFLLLLLPGFVVRGQTTELIALEGRLPFEKGESTIVYLGDETGDLAAFCFLNKSKVGRLFLSKCKKW